MKKFSYRIGDIEARTALINAKEGKNTIEVVKWEGESCYVLAFFQTEYEQERCTLLQRAIKYENLTDLMRVIKVASNYIEEENSEAQRILDTGEG